MTSEHRDHETSEPGDEQDPPGGSGTTSPPDRLQRQAGSYARDAQQDPDSAPAHDDEAEP